MKTPHIRFRIDFTESANLGPGKIALLELIKELGSLSDAARALGLTYRRAWLLLDSLNKSFDTPATVSTTGGNGGGGVQVTPFGVLMIKRYRALERRISGISNDCLREIANRAVQGPRPVARLRRPALARKLNRARTLP